LGEYGKSAAGRSLYFLDIYKESKEEKPVVIILSRQHPPEISGYLAMRHFVETLLDNNVLSTNFMNKFRVLVFPMLNPDGVDNGHWRHNMHGIDLNRDWGVYLQPEVKQTVDFIVREVKMNDNQVLLGLDFHSTQEDIFYTYADSLVSVIPGFTENWLFAIDEALPGYELEEEASGITKPYSKVWFYTQFGAESITYEVGDETSRAFVREKARVAAREMMKLLMFYQHE
jgi:predicted deacylase